MDGKSGTTRSVLRREYLLHAPDSFVRTPMAGLENGLAVVHASPELGAGFVQYAVEFEAGGVLAACAEQRFVWVLEGYVQVGLEANAGAVRNDGKARFYAYLPGGEGEIRAVGAARVMVIEKRYEALEGLAAPLGFWGAEEDVAAVALGGDKELMVKALLPGDVAFDFAVNTMTYAPGAALPQVEVHVMEHGLVMLEGSGEYRLGEERYEVRAGDFIWMAGYCPQWFQAGEAGAKYLIYKDWNRRPRL